MFNNNNKMWDTINVIMEGVSVLGITSIEQLSG